MKTISNKNEKIVKTSFGKIKDKMTIREDKTLEEVDPMMNEWNEGWGRC